jgi:hypothetical protein
MRSRPAATSYSTPISPRPARRPTRWSPSEKAIILVALVSLAGTVTNLIPLSALLAVPAVIGPLLLLGRRSIPVITFSLVVMLGYFLLWALVYHPFSILEYGFYRRDGNVFITFAPLLFLALLRLDLDVDRVVRGFLYLASGLAGHRPIRRRDADYERFLAALTAAMEAGDPDLPVSRISFDAGAVDYLLEGARVGAELLGRDARVFHELLRLDVERGRSAVEQTRRDLPERPGGRLPPRGEDRRVNGPRAGRDGPPCHPPDRPLRRGSAGVGTDIR